MTVQTSTVMPECAKCGKPVDMILRDSDMFTGEIKYTVKCHGETQTTTLHQGDIMTAFNIEFAKVFEPE